MSGKGTGHHIFRKAGAAAGLGIAAHFGMGVAHSFGAMKAHKVGDTAARDFHAYGAAQRGINMSFHPNGVSKMHFGGAAKTIGKAASEI